MEKTADATRQGHDYPVLNHPPTTPPQRARNGGMAAHLFVRELPATIRDLLPSTAAIVNTIEQQRRKKIFSRNARHANGG
eukprot:scaffold127_cov138-Isochrysis_galbana.AAC.2